MYIFAGMKRGKIVLAALCLLSFAVGLGAQPSGNIKDIVSRYRSPEPEAMVGTWNYCDGSLVFMEKDGVLPPLSEVKSLMGAIGVNPSDFHIDFRDLKKCTFRVGKKTFNVNWEVLEDSREIRLYLGPAGLKGYLVDDGGRLFMVFTRTNLNIMLNVLCDGSERKNLKPLGQLLDTTKGLSYGFLFTKQ